MFDYVHLCKISLLKSDESDTLKIATIHYLKN